jgi:Tol biopolymer transport system component
VDSPHEADRFRVRSARTLGFAGAAIALVAAVAVFAVSHHAAADRSALDAPIPMPAQQLTVSPGLDAFPTLSPDGRLVAYASNESGAFEIHVRAMSGGAAERPVTADRQQNVEPAWSPDGELIAYHSRRFGGIWAVPALGGAPRKISEFGSRPAWSPDGRHLAFQSDPCTDVSPFAYSANIPSVIWITDRDGRHGRAVTATGRPIGAHGSPSWSPDGRRIAFVTSAAGEPGLWTVPAGGGEPARVARTGDVFDPVFSPDGRTIYAATGGESMLAIPVSPETGVATARPERILVAGAGSVRHLSISRDGLYLAMAGLSLGSHIWTIPMSGDRATGAPAVVTVERVRRQTRPAFSPGGGELAFWTSRPGAGSEVWLVDPAGGPASPMTSSDFYNPMFYAGASWVATGRQLVFRVHRASSVRVAKMDLDSRRETTVLEVPRQGGTDDEDEALLNADDLAVSPDGLSAAYSRIEPEAGRPRLYVRRFAERSAHAVTDGEWPERFPVWSPDGRTLAYELKKDDATNVAVVPASGGSPRLLTAERNESWPFGWSPGGDRIVYAALREGLWNLWWVSPETGISRQLTTYTSANTFVRYPAWSPRGDRIAYELGTVTGNIWVGRLPNVK